MRTMLKQKRSLHQQAREQEILTFSSLSKWTRTACGVMAAEVHSVLLLAEVRARSAERTGCRLILGKALLPKRAICQTSGEWHENIA